MLAAHKLLFTGDHVLGGVSPVILPPDGDMAAYIHSLDKLVAYDFERIAPGHGELMAQGKRVVELLRAHRMQREAKVLRCLASAKTLDALVPAVYDDVPAERHGWARLTLQAHLIKLARESKVSEQDGVWRVDRRMTERLGVSLRAVSVRRGREWALKDVTLELAPGGRWALLGENGSGKTQLLKLLAGDVWPTPIGPGSAHLSRRAARDRSHRGQVEDRVSRRRAAG